jgi:TPR repeat protein
MEFIKIKELIDLFIIDTTDLGYYYEQITTLFMDMSIEDEKQTYQYCKSLVDNKNVHAYILLGDIYYYGIHVKKNHIEATYWYNMSSTAGIAYGNCALAYMSYYHTNAGDIKMAGKWIDLTLTSNNAFIKRNIAQIYISSNTNMIKAIKLLKSAITQKCEFAKDTLNKLLIKNSYVTYISELIDENDKLQQQIDSQAEYIEQLELMPEGPKYKEAKDHFDSAKIL